VTKVVRMVIKNNARLIFGLLGFVFGLTINLMNGLPSFFLSTGRYPVGSRAFTSLRNACFEFGWSFM